MNSWICLIQNKFNSSFQFAFTVNFACWTHLPLLTFKKTSNNLSHKWKPIRRVKPSLLLRQSFLMIMSNGVWNASLILLNQNQFLTKKTFRHQMSQPYFGQVWGWSPTLGKSEDLESSRTPECLEFDSKAQNTSHLGVLDVIWKVLKRRYRKWPRIGHLDICSPSYGQKKGRESNWQFDSRPLNVWNRPLPDLRIESAIRRWKDLDEGYKFGLDLVAIRPGSRELWAPKVSGLHPG